MKIGEDMKKARDEEERRQWRKDHRGMKNVQRESGL